MLYLELLVAKEQPTALLESQRMQENQVNCMDTCLETMENFFVGTKIFLAKLRTKASILETTTIQKFNKVNVQLDTLQAIMDKALGLLELTLKDLRLTTLKSVLQVNLLRKLVPLLFGLQVGKVEEQVTSSFIVTRRE